jgi:hypothetical protein
LLHAANFEHDVNSQSVVHFQVDVRRDELLESGGRGSDLVASGWQSKYLVGTVCSRNGFLLEIGVHIRDYNACASHYGLRPVVYHTQNRSGYVRTQSIRAKQRYQNEEKS